MHITIHPLPLIGPKCPSSVAFSNMHDRWLEQKVRAWGNELRGEKATTGRFPTSMARNLHGYPARFVNNGNPYDPPVIIFHKFGEMRQAYVVPEDRFLAEVES